MKKIVLSILLFASACAPTPVTVTPTPILGASPSIGASTAIIRVYATPATQTWQADLFKCAAEQSSVVALSDAGSADVLLHLGEPPNLSMPAFQLGWDEVLVVVNKSHSFQQLRTEQVTGLFTGAISDWSQIAETETGTVQVWVFADGDDAQQVFAKTLAGKPVSSTARLATSPQEMSDAISNDPHAVGILPGRWKTGILSDVYVAASAPVLAITPLAPQGAVKDLLACLQG
jgi:hypothetical protein